MALKIDRHQIQLAAPIKIPIQDTLSFVEDHNFFSEFLECGLDDDDFEYLQIGITLTPESGSVVPVSENVRDAFYVRPPLDTVVVRYVYLAPANTVLLLTAYPGEASLPLTSSEAMVAESYIQHQLDYFSQHCTE